MRIPPELLMRIALEGPEKFGFRQCPHCNGYGSSLKEEADRCTMCGGSGVIEKEKGTK